VPVAPDILLRPGIQFKSVKSNSLHANANVRERRTYLPIEAVLVHSQVSRRISEAHESWGNGIGTRPGDASCTAVFQMVGNLRARACLDDARIEPNYFAGVFHMPRASVMYGLRKQASRAATHRAEPGKTCSACLGFGATHRAQCTRAEVRFVGRSSDVMLALLGYDTGPSGDP